MSGAGSLHELATAAGAAIYVIDSTEREQPVCVAAFGASSSATAALEALAALDSDATRAMRHFESSGYDSIVVESSKGAIGVAPVRIGRFVCVSRPEASAPGSIERLLSRAAGTARQELP